MRTVRFSLGFKRITINRERLQQRRVAKRHFASRDYAHNPLAGGRTIPPSYEMVRGYLKSIGSDLDPQDFMEFYAARDWTVDSRGKVDRRALDALAVEASVLKGTP